RQLNAKPLAGSVSQPVFPNPRMLYWHLHPIDDERCASYSAAVQPGIAADRFAREIVCFLKAVSSALAATECHPVGHATPISPPAIHSHRFTTSPQSRIISS